MHHKHLGLGAVMVESDGWQRPSRYTSADRELEQVQSAVGVCDISSAGKLMLQGTEIGSMLNDAISDIGQNDSGSARRHRIGTGANVQSIVIARLAHDEVMVLTAPNQARSVAEALGERPGRCSHVLDVTSSLAGVRIAGPSGHLLLAGVAELDVTSAVFSDMTCVQASVAEIQCVLMRLGQTGPPTYDLYFGREFGEYMWSALLEAGEEYAVIPFGTEALALMGQE